MTISHGFEKVRDEEIADINSKVTLYRHVKTGAELLSLQNEDENKVFGVTFRTPPDDSTGVAHIMEHSVLGGSQKYPVKEPFVQLLKGSLKTFLNAFTSSDWTAYPVASQNLQDFYNLVDVYLDSVFYPLLTRHHLDQEGWHYELENPDDPLTYRGIVFNEMKGAYSSPEGVFGRYNQSSLFPGHVYGHDSGGAPTAIPDLTYEQFKQFHETFYHPSNARFFFYGDAPENGSLQALDQVLQDFDRLEMDTRTPPPTPFDEPVRLTHTYNVDADDDLKKKSMVQVNWVLPEPDDPQLTMALSILSYALVSSPASPLRKTLIDSGLGEELTGGGLDSYLRNMTFGIGMKGVDTADTAQVESLILDTLVQLAETGLEPDMVEAAINTIEFSLRENNTGAFPRGLLLMLRAMRTWLHDGDPMEPLQYEAPLTAVKAKIASNPTYLQTLIQRYFVENDHRSTVLLEPEPGLGQKLDEAERERLAQAKAAMSTAEIDAIIENTKTLRELQQAPDTPEALATIPRLTLDDLDKSNKPIPLAVMEVAGVRVVTHDLFTNGIVYLDVGFDLHSLTPDLLPYVKLFGRALVEMGTDEEDFVKLTQRIGRKTGGIRPVTWTSASRQQDAAEAWFFLRAKSTLEQAEEMLAILRDVLLTVKLDDRDRFRQIVLKAKATKEASLIPSGHAVVANRLNAHFDESAWIDEKMGGIENLFFLRQLLEQIDADWDGVLAKLEAVRTALVNRNAMLCNVTLDDDSMTAFQPLLEKFVAAMPAPTAVLNTWKPALLSGHEGLTIPAQVNYVGKGANLYQLGYQLHGSVLVISQYLRTSWLWDTIRAQGGAYGAFSRFDPFSGLFSYGSYRDPNLEKTLHNYDQTAVFLRDLDLSEDELVKGIIGAIGTLDAYQLPDAKGITALQRYLIGYTDDQRQQYRDEILATTADHFQAFATVLAQVADAGEVVVLGSAEAIAKANDADWLQVQKVM